METIIRLAAYLQASATHLRHRANERGEGVISAAIAVLIIAAVGVGAWASFNSLFSKASTKAEESVDKIGK